MKAVIGIDTSCYTTSCAAVDESCRVLLSERKMLPVEAGKCGLRQSDAVFLHMRQFPELFAKVVKGLRGYSTIAVSSSAKPSDGEDSYMPVFMTGLSFARAIAAAYDVPCYETTHQRGHLAAAMIDQPALPSRHLAVHLSGGTTDFLIKDEHVSLKLVAKGLDLHAGQLIDRVGVAMGLPFPAGSMLEKLAMQGLASGRYPAAIRKGGFHLSGAEAAALRDISAGIRHENIAAEVFDLLVRSVLKMLDVIAEKTGLSDVLLTGGVATSTLLRTMMEERNKARRLGLSLSFALPEYAGDNAAGIAMIGMERALKQ